MKALFIIDPQNDFCHKDGSLFVPNADKDIMKIAKFVNDNGNYFERIFVSLDSHYANSIFLPMFWKDKDGNYPVPYTVITKTDIDSGRWVPRDEETITSAALYVQTLERNGKFKLTIWPQHCLLGTWGHNVAEPLMSTLMNFSNVEFLIKGMARDTEMYSAFCSEMPTMAEERDSKANIRHILTECDDIAFCGEARTHCVRNSIASITDYIDESGDKELYKKISVLIDAMSDVPIPELVASADKFFSDLKEKGADITTTEKYFI